MEGNTLPVLSYDARLPPKKVIRALDSQLRQPMTAPESLSRVMSMADQMIEVH
jgi:hypothetical protein